MMELPLPGDRVGDLTVEESEVSHEADGWRGYVYTVRIVMRGPGGIAGVRRAVAPLFSKRVLTFSSYGNPYELWFGKAEVESLGDRRYAVLTEAAGARIELGIELERFLDHLTNEGHVSPDQVPPAMVVEAYLESYRDDVKRRVDRYRRLLRKREAQPEHSGK
jgi:hypothetical protein